jgi:RNA polymerase sigma factor (sigma-70 family)
MSDEDRGEHRDFPEKNSRDFPATQWSMVVRAGGGISMDAHSALEHLCRRYWIPLYAFVRRQGKSHHEAEDCTQEFLLRLLASDGVGRAKPELGRFRTFLLTSLRNFLTNEWRRAAAAKRGGGHVLLPLEFDVAEKTFSREPADSALTPEQAFDRNWAFGLIDQAIASLREEYSNSGRQKVFEALYPYVWGSDTQGSLAIPAERLNMTSHSFTVALQRLRQRVGQRLRSQVAETVADPGEIDAELRHLIAVMTSFQNVG